MQTFLRKAHGENKNKPEELVNISCLTYWRRYIFSQALALRMQSSF